MQDVIIVLIIFGAMFGVLYLFFTTRHRERLALIEKGADASLFKSASKFRWSLLALFIGMLAVGVALGVITGAWINSATTINEEIAFTAMIFLFGGASLILYYFFIRKKESIKE